VSSLVGTAGDNERVIRATCNSMRAPWDDAGFESMPAGC
jgi:hypothetical protein